MVKINSLPPYHFFCPLHTGNTGSCFHFKKTKIKELNIFQFSFSRRFSKQGNKLPMSHGAWMRTKKKNYSLLLKAVILLNWNQHEPFVLNGWELQKYFFLSQVLVNLSHRQFQTLSFVRKKK